MSKSIAVFSALLLAAGTGAAPTDELPDFGSPADAALSKNREEQLGRGVMLQLYNAGVVIDDPELNEYVSSLGRRIASHATDGSQQFRFFIVDDEDINAFALPGGYIGVNSGLLLTTETEDELAAVLAHEISHVTQRHIARSLYESQRTSIASMAAILAAVLLGANDAISGDAMSGVVTATQALSAQRQINFTRANEHEADRVGMGLLAAAGFDPRGMAGFFERLQRRTGGLDDTLPELLRSHPVTSERIAEARARERQLPSTTGAASPSFGLTKARLVALHTPTVNAAYASFKSRDDSREVADRYGTALASMRMGLNDNAEQLFRDLVADYPTIIAFRTGQAEALFASGLTDRALALYAESVRLFPRNIPLTISYAEALISAGQPTAAHEILLDLLNNVVPTPEQLRLIARAANAEGDIGNAYFYMSYYYSAIGNLPLAIGQLRLALESPNVHTVDRARFEARLTQLIEYLPEEQRARVASGGPVPRP